MEKQIYELKSKLIYQKECHHDYQEKYEDVQ
jgi:hypothetical protein